MFTMLLCAEHIIPIAGEPIDDGAVLVRDGRIVEVGGAQRMKAHYPQEEVRDFGRSAIMPGFVDCHTHLEYTALRGIVHDVPYAEWLVTEHAKADMMSRDDRYDSAVIGGMEMIAGGVTTVADFTSTGASFEAAQDVGLRGKFYRSVGATSKSQVDTAIEEAVADIECWRSEADSDRMQIGIAPKALHACHPTIFSKVNEVAEKLDLPVAMHVAGSYEEYSYIMRGSTPLSVRGIETGGDALTDRPMWLPTGVTPVNYALNWNAFNSHDVLAAHCVHVDENDIAKLKEHDVAISVNTRCNAQLGMGLAPLPTFLKSGIRVGLGTDSPAATDSSDMFIEMRLGMLIHRSVDRDYSLPRKPCSSLPQSAAPVHCIWKTRSEPSSPANAPILRWSICLVRVRLRLSTPLRRSSKAALRLMSCSPWSAASQFTSAEASGTCAAISGKCSSIPPRLVSVACRFAES